MADGQPTRPRYRRQAHPCHTYAEGVYLTSPPDSIPTRNVPIFVPRQAPNGSSFDPAGSDPGGPSGTPSSSNPTSSPTSQPSSTATEDSLSTDSLSTFISTSTSVPTSTTPTATSDSTDSTSSPTSSTSSSTPSLTQPPQSFGSSSFPHTPPTTITGPAASASGGATSTVNRSQSTAVIVGAVAGGLAFIILAVVTALFYRRHQKKKRGFFPASEPKPRTMLLSAEDLDDDFAYSRQTSNAPTPLPSSVRRMESPISTIPRSSSVEQSPRLLRPRASETGSIFHEGGIWPPPADGSRLVDPILAGSNINLSNIIDDVMGSSIGQQNTASGSNTAIRPRGGNPSIADTATIYSEGSIYSTDLPTFVPNEGQGHTRGASSTSHTPLIPPEPLYLASTHYSGSSPSIMSPRHEQSFDPSRSSTSISNPNGTRNWLDRSPRKISESPTDPFNRNSSPSFPR